jgi:hypothetical protein
MLNAVPLLRMLEEVVIYQIDEGRCGRLYSAVRLPHWACIELPICVSGGVKAPYDHDSAHAIVEPRMILPVVDSEVGVAAYFWWLVCSGAY